MLELTPTLGSLLSLSTSLYYAWDLCTTRSSIITTLIQITLSIIIEGKITKFVKLVGNKINKNLRWQQGNHGPGRIWSVIIHTRYYFHWRNKLHKLFKFCKAGMLAVWNLIPAVQEEKAGVRESLLYNVWYSQKFHLRQCSIVAEKEMSPYNGTLLWSSSRGLLLSLTKGPTSWRESNDKAESTLRVKEQRN